MNPRTSALACAILVLLPVAAPVASALPYAGILPPFVGPGDTLVLANGTFLALVPTVVAATATLVVDNATVEFAAANPGIVVLGAIVVKSSLLAPIAGIDVGVFEVAAEAGSTIRLHASEVKGGRGVRVATDDFSASATTFRDLETALLFDGADAASTGNAFFDNGVAVKVASGKVLLDGNVIQNGTSGIDVGVFEVAAEAGSTIRLHASEVKGGRGVRVATDDFSASATTFRDLETALLFDGADAASTGNAFFDNGVAVKVASGKVLLDGNVIQNGTSGIDVEGANVTVSKNALSGMANGIVARGSEILAKQNHLADSSDPFSRGIAILAGSTATIAGNTLVAWGTAILVEDSEANVTENDVDDASAGWGGGSGGAHDGVRVVNSNATIAGNSMDDSSDPWSRAIAILAGSEAKVSKNVLTAWGTAVFVDNSDVVIEENTIADDGGGWPGGTPHEGIRLEGATGLVTANAAADSSDPWGKGISVLEGSVATVSWNTLTAWGTGIHVEGSTVTLHNNTVEDSVGYGVEASGASGSLSSTDDVVRGGGGGFHLSFFGGDATFVRATGALSEGYAHGLYAEHAGATTVLGGNFSGNGGHGIEIQAPAGPLLVEGALADDNAASGIRVLGGSFAAVRNSSASRNGDRGIHVSVGDVGAHVAWNVVSDPGAHGIQVGGNLWRPIVVEGNVVTRAGTNGVDILNTQDARIANNTVVDPGVRGILLSNAQAKVVDNDVLSTVGSPWGGIAVGAFSEFSEVRRNLVDGPFQAGIRVLPNDVTLSDNDVRGALAYGILSNHTARLKLANDRARDVAGIGFHLFSVTSLNATGITATGNDVGILVASSSASLYRANASGNARGIVVPAGVAGLVLSYARAIGNTLVGLDLDAPVDARNGWFEGNGVAGVDAVGVAGVDVRSSWWGKPTGPTTPLNPGGLGDKLLGSALFDPHRLAPPP